jgi:hypothetical protein
MVYIYFNTFSNRLFVQVFFNMDYTKIVGSFFCLLAAGSAGVAAWGSSRGSMRVAGEGMGIGLIFLEGVGRAGLDKVGCRGEGWGETEGRPMQFILWRVTGWAGIKGILTGPGTLMAF